MKVNRIDRITSINPGLRIDTSSEANSLNYSNELFANGVENFTASYTIGHSLRVLFNNPL